MKIALATALVLLPSLALAQDAQDKAAATALFDEGRALAAQGHYDQACPMFEASVKLVPGLGARLNLADCYERIGRLASAWSEFRAAAALAAEKKDPREVLANERAAALAPRLAHLTVSLGADAAVAGLIATRDGQPITPEQLGAAVPVDAGEHVIRASAPGRESFTTRVPVADGAAARVEIPVLAEKAEPEPPPPAPERAPEPPRDRGRGLRIVGLVTLGAGVAAVGLGVKFGLDAKSLSDDLSSATGTWTADQDQMITDGKNAEKRMWILYGAGGAAIVAGGTMWLIGVRARPSASEAAVSWRPVVGTSSVGLAAAVRF